MLQAYDTRWRGIGPASRSVRLKPDATYPPVSCLLSSVLQSPPVPIDYAKARRTLARRDPVMRDLMRRHGACGLADAQHQDPFRALVHAIISQQLSSKASATIERRFDALPCCNRCV